MNNTVQNVLFLLLVSTSVAVPFLIAKHVPSQSLASKRLLLSAYPCNLCSNLQICLPLKARLVRSPDALLYDPSIENNLLNAAGIASGTASPCGWPTTSFGSVGSVASIGSIGSLWSIGKPCFHIILLSCLPYLFLSPKLSITWRHRLLYVLAQA